MLTAVAGMQRDLTEWILAEPERSAGRIVLVLMVAAALLAVPLLVAATLMWRFAERINRAERFPPPGTAVVRDTEVLTGAPARRRALVLKAFSVFFAIAAVVVPVSMWRIAQSLGRSVSD